MKNGRRKLSVTDLPNMSNRCGNEEVIRGKICMTNYKVYLYQRFIRNPFILELFIYCVMYVCFFGHNAQLPKTILIILVCTNFIYIFTYIKGLRLYTSGIFGSVVNDCHYLCKGYIWDMGSNIFYCLFF